MDKKDPSADAEHMEYVYRLYIYHTDDTVRQIEIDLPDAESRLSEVGVRTRSIEEADYASGELLSDGMQK